MYWELLEQRLQVESRDIFAPHQANIRVDNVGFSPQIAGLEVAGELAFSSVQTTISTENQHILIENSANRAQRLDISLAEARASLWLDGLHWSSFASNLYADIDLTGAWRALVLRQTDEEEAWLQGSLRDTRLARLALEDMAVRVEGRSLFLVGEATRLELDLAENWRDLSLAPSHTRLELAGTEVALELAATLSLASPWQANVTLAGNSTVLGQGLALTGRLVLGQQGLDLSVQGEVARGDFWLEAARRQGLWNGSFRLDDAKPFNSQLSFSSQGDILGEPLEVQLDYLASYYANDLFGQLSLSGDSLSSQAFLVLDYASASAELSPINIALDYAFASRIGQLHLKQQGEHLRLLWDGHRLESEGSFSLEQGPFALRLSASQDREGLLLDIETLANRFTSSIQREQLNPWQANYQLAGEQGALFVSARGVDARDFHVQTVFGRLELNANLAFAGPWRFRSLDGDISANFYVAPEWQALLDEELIQVSGAARASTLSLFAHGRHSSFNGSLDLQQYSSVFKAQSYSENIQFSASGVFSPQELYSLSWDIHLLDLRGYVSGAQLHSQGSIAKQQVLASASLLATGGAELARLDGDCLLQDIALMLGRLPSSEGCQIELSLRQLSLSSQPQFAASFPHADVRLDGSVSVFARQLGGDLSAKLVFEDSELDMQLLLSGTLLAPQLELRQQHSYMQLRLQQRELVGNLRLERFPLHSLFEAVYGSQGLEVIAGTGLPGVGSTVVEL